MALSGELIGFDPRTGEPVVAAAGLGRLVGFNKKTGKPVRAMAGGCACQNAVGGYADITPNFYRTFQHENWQHPGSTGWSAAPVPGWGENPNLQMFARRAAVGDTESTMKSMGLFLALGVVGFLALSGMSEKPSRRA